MDYPLSDPSIGLIGGKFTDGNPAGGVAASRDPSSWANLVTDELLNVLAGAGIAPNEAIANQMAIAIQSGKLNIATDTGAANAYVCTFAPAILALTDGLTLSFEAANANTGASTLNVNGLGAQPILGGAHAALQGGEIIAGGKITVQWSALLASFVLLARTGGAVQVAAGAKSGQAINLGQLASLIGVSGYKKIPDPNSPSGFVIIQWGTIAATNLGTIAFPITFPNACLSLAVAEANQDGTAVNAQIVGYKTLSTTSFVVTVVSFSGGGTSSGASFIAIGY